jgi:hypothetical protein
MLLIETQLLHHAKEESDLFIVTTCIFDFKAEMFKVFQRFVEEIFDFAG